MDLRTNQPVFVTSREAMLLVLVGVGVLLDVATTVIGVRAAPPTVVFRERNPVAAWLLHAHGLSVLVSAKLVTYGVCCGLFSLGASLVDAQYRWVASLLLTAIIGVYVGVISWNLTQLLAVL